jgi:transposase
MAERLTTTQRRALRQEAARWDRLDDGDFARLFEQARPVRERLRRPSPKPLTIALDEPTLNALKRMARRKQVRARHLAAMWIAERLAKEYPTERSRRLA